jgi:type I restriction enzyme, S subunit
MKSNYKRLGDYIKPVKEKNIDLKASKLLGINIDKFFMPSVANVIGTDMSNYKIVKKGQFACNRMHVGRDYRIPIALSKEEIPFMVSPAYDVFEIIDTDVLLPEYLMMWFSRKEFDRNTWFHTDADVRGGLPWSAFCDLELPIPTIEKQQELVREYYTIQNRIALNNQLISKLEETAQAIYKQWFVEDTEEFITIGDLFNPKKGKNITRENATDGKFPVVAGGLEPSCYHNEFNTSMPVVTVSASGANAGFVRLYHTNVWAADCSYIDKNIFDEVYFAYVSLKINQALLMSKQEGTGQPHIYPEHIVTIPIFGFTEEKLKMFNDHCKAIFNRVKIAENENQKLEELKELLLAKMTRVEN